MAQPVEVDRLRDELLNLYVAAQQDLDRQLREIADAPNRTVLRRRLRAMSADVEQAMASLDRAAREWAQTRLVTVYELGARATEPQLGAFSWTQVDRVAVQQLAGDTFQDLLSATRFLRADVKRFVREAARREVRRAVIEGRTATQAGRDLAQVLTARFGDLDLPAAVRYRNGARHTLGDWSDMAMRTRTATVFNAGSINATKAAGVGYMECADGFGCGLSSHQDPVKAHGRVFPIDVAEAYPIAHPRCARAWFPAPTVTTAAQAAAADRIDPAERRRLQALEEARAAERTVSGRLTARERTRRRRQRTASRTRRRAGAR